MYYSYYFIIAITISGFFNVFIKERKDIALTKIARERREKKEDERMERKRRGDVNSKRSEH